jgi:tetratricopeptide (TPR) repeat protein
MRAWIIALVLGTAGDEKKSVQAVCPVDGTRFTAVEVVTTNEWGGIDADFCPHAFKTTPLEFYVWVCPACAFAGKKKDFAEKLPEEQKKALRSGLRPLVEIPPDARQADIPGHVKYDLLAQTARIRGARPEEVGKAYLYASWSCRQQGAIALDDFDEWTAVRNGYGLNRTPLALGTVGSGEGKRMRNRTEFELEAAKRLEKDVASGKHKGAQRILARYLAAYLYRRHGENADAERRLKELDALRGENSVVDEAVDLMRRSMSREREFQGKATEGYAAAFASGGLPAGALPEVAYLLGELHRRTGNPRAASEWYQKALDASPPEALRKLASAQKALLPP